MSRRTISLKSRVRYEGLSQIFDRRANLEPLPDRIWYTVSQVLGRNSRKMVRGRKSGTTTAIAKPALPDVGSR